MKNIWIALLMVCTAFAFNACTDDEEGVDPKSPVTLTGALAAGTPGEEYVVKATGFAETAKLSLKKDGKETPLTGVEFTAAGATFVIPADIVPGEYTLVLVQAGTWELGKIKINEVEFPLTDAEYPAELFIGKTLTIGGNGFNETAKVYLVPAEGERIELEIVDRTTGLTCNVPSGLEAGAKYALVFAQDGGEWTIVEELVAAQPAKRIASIKCATLVEIDVESTLAMYAEMPDMYEQMLGVTSAEELETMLAELEGSASQEYTEVYTYGDNGIQSIEGGMRMLTFETSAAKIEGYDEGLGESFVLNLEEGKIVSSENDYGSAIWEYNTDGYLQKSFDTDYVFENGNYMPLNDMDDEVFVYGTEVNNVYGIDIAMFLYADNMQLYNEDYCAVVLNLCGKKSTNLPKSMNLMGMPSDLGYEFDGDGYVTKINVAAFDYSAAFGGLIVAEAVSSYEFVYE